MIAGPSALLRDRQEVPGVLRAALYVMLVAAGALSVPMIGRYGPLPTTALLDAWIIAFLVISAVRGRTREVVLVLVLVGYALTRVVPALANGSPIVDFLQAYRWLLYLVVFAFAVGRRWGPIRPLVRVMWLLLGMAFLKAALTFFLAPGGTRPGLLLENNFELALFSGLVAVLYRHLGRGRPWAVLLLGGLTLLAGSRSGAVAFLVLALYAITQIPATRANLLQRFVLACAVPVLVLVPVWVFASRAEATRIDRLNFLDVFLFETRSWDVVTWLMGSPPITPLTQGCIALSYYSDLFASTGDGTCYAVILHAFALRVVFDAGVIGAALAFGVIWLTMRRAGAARLLAACILLIAVTNSLSVSGPNNPYVALPVLLAILCAPTVRDDRHESAAQLRTLTTPGGRHPRLRRS